VKRYSLKRINAKVCLTERFTYRSETKVGISVPKLFCGKRFA